MKKENIFDLYAAQHKDEPAHDAERVPGEVTPEDVAPPREVSSQVPEPEQIADPEPPQEPEQIAGGEQNGV